MSEVELQMSCMKAIGPLTMLITSANKVRGEVAEMFAYRPVVTTVTTECSENACVRTTTLTMFIMAALCSRCGHYSLVLFLLSSFLLFFLV